MELQTIATHLFAYMLGSLTALVAYALICANVFNKEKEEK